MRKRTKKCVSTHSIRDLDMSSSKKKLELSATDRFNEIMPIYGETNKISLEQYKLISTLMFSFNGASVLILSKIDIDRYVISIFWFAFGIFVSIIMFCVSYVISNIFIRNFRYYVMNKIDIITKLLNYFKKNKRTIYKIEDVYSVYFSISIAINYFNIAGIFFSALCFEFGFFSALFQHNFDLKYILSLLNVNMSR